MYERLKQGYLIIVIKRECTRPIIIVSARLKHNILRFDLIVKDWWYDSERK